MNHAWLVSSSTLAEQITIDVVLIGAASVSRHNVRKEWRNRRIELWGQSQCAVTASRDHHGYHEIRSGNVRTTREIVDRVTILLKPEHAALGRIVGRIVP